MNTLQLLEQIRVENVYESPARRGPWFWEAHRVLNALPESASLDNVPELMAQLLAEGLAAAPPEDTSFYVLTEAGLEALRAGT